MKIDLHDTQGEVVELEITRPASGSYGVWTMIFFFPDHTFRIVTLNKWDLKALMSELLETL